MIYIKCPRCNSNLTWGNDFDAEDVGIDGHGIVSYFNCNCGVTAEAYYPLEQEETAWIKYYMTDKADR